MSLICSWMKISFCFCLFHICRSLLADHQCRCTSVRSYLCVQRWRTDAWICKRLFLLLSLFTPFISFLLSIDFFLIYIFFNFYLLSAILCLWQEVEDEQELVCYLVFVTGSRGGTRRTNLLSCVCIRKEKRKQKRNKKN